MKKILGLDLGTTSIGWALVNEKESENEKSSIEKVGVRIIPLSTDEENDFQKGKPTTLNANRTIKRGMRRNLHRYKLRNDQEYWKNQECDRIFPAQRRRAVGPTVKQPCRSLCWVCTVHGAF